jgi:hypothetical protein
VEVASDDDEYDNGLLVYTASKSLKIGLTFFFTITCCVLLFLLELLIVVLVTAVQHIGVVAGRDVKWEDCVVPVRG